MSEPEVFEAFPKIARLSRECVITEKIDGTNGQILITEAGDIIAGSRSRWLTLREDNFGFARWVEENHVALFEELGIGCHYGEWWGSGIQRGYGLVKGEKRFSLFNVKRWKDEPLTVCGVVPVLYEGPFSTAAIEQTLIFLEASGSEAAKGFMNPEGIVIYHKAANMMFKKTLENDAEPKGVIAKVKTLAS